MGIINIMHYVRTKGLKISPIFNVR